MTAPERQQLVHHLRQQLQHLEHARPPTDQGRFSAGHQAVDRLLPGGGLFPGMLIEWVAIEAGSGGGLLGLLAAQEACRRGGQLVVVERQASFYPPAAAAWGIDLARTLVVRPANQADHQWALIQSLESAAVAAVWSPLEKIQERAFRRLHLAAQTGNTLGVLLRPAAARDRPTWADVQFWATPVADAEERRVEVCLARCRSGRPGARAMIEIAEADGTLHHATPTPPDRLPVAAPLARATTVDERSRA